MKERYKIVEGSESAHCCFDVTIVDTSRPESLTKEVSTPYYYNMAECFYKEDAVLIVNALNYLENHRMDGEKFHDFS